MTQPHTWRDSIKVGGNLIVANGATLTVESGTCIYIEPHAKIEVEGTIIIQGTEQNPVVFDCANPAETWAGIRVSSDNQNNRLDHNTVRNATMGVVVDDGFLNVSDCIFDDCEYGLVYLYSRGTVEDSRMTDNTRFGAFLIDGDVSLMNNQFLNNGQGGIRIVRGGHRLHGNTFNANGISHETTRPIWSGIEILGGFAQMSCNTIYRNEGPGLYLFASGFAAMHGNGWNNIFENMLRQDLLNFDYGQIYLQGGVATLASGLNTIQTGNDTDWLIHTSSAPIQSMNYEYNYWGTTDTSNIASRLPENTNFQPFYDRSYDCGTVPMGGGDYDHALLTFDAAWELEHQGLFTEALDYYTPLIREYGNPPYGKHPYLKIALDRQAFCKSATSWSWSDIRQYFLDLAADSLNDTTLVSQCKTSAAWCLANMGNFDDAETELQALIDVSTKEEDIIRNQLHLILVDLRKLDEQGLFNVQPDPNRPRGTLDSDADPNAFRQDESSEKIRLVSNRLDALISGRSIADDSPLDETTTIIPTEYVLYQNYPNPFNPTTQIRYDIPEATRVSISVYNTLGQFVTALQDGVQSAGSYTVLWDGKNNAGLDVATGMYILRMESGNFTDTKKMLLLK